MPASGYSPFNGGLSDLGRGGGAVGQGSLATRTSSMSSGDNHKAMLYLIQSTNSIPALESLRITLNAMIGDGSLNLMHGEIMFQLIDMKR